MPTHLSSNPYEQGARKAIPAVLVYLERDQKILMLHRVSKQEDFHLGKWNGLGGKCEADESPLEAAAREVEEECGVRISMESFHPLGVVQFPNFKPTKSEDWIVFVFTAMVSGEARPLTESAEGKLSWIDKNDLLSLNLWPGDRHFLPYVLSKRPFLGTIWYNGPSVSRHWITAL
ncbi:MAG: 8-oxo-dGTP diphosphatase [Bdellovibrionota bacterium]